MAEKEKPQSLAAAGLSCDKSSVAGSAEIRPCLIGGFHAVNDTSPSYWHGYFYSDGSRFSIDMVRLGLHFFGVNALTGEDPCQRFREIDYKLIACDENKSYTAKIRPGAWREIYNWKLGESSVTLGLGHFKASCKLDEHKAFLEFNPNKVCGDDRFWDLIEKLRTRCIVPDSARLIRYDLAYDVPQPKNRCYVSKDRRRYEAIISSGVTEYLGVKNTPGFVKVYDKQAEAKLESPLTRIELTCSEEWDAAQIEKHWPKVHAWRCPDSTRDWVAALGLAVSRLAERGEEVETIINMLGRESKKKVRDQASGSLIGLPPGAAEAARNEALSWAWFFASDSMRAAFR